MMNYLVKTSNLRLFIVTITLLIMLSCSFIKSGQSNLASQHALEANEKFELLWNRLDIQLNPNDRRSSMVGLPSKMIVLGSESSGTPTGKVIGLNSLTGETVWTVPGASLGEIISHRENLYRGTYGTATVQSYNAENGKLIWETVLPFAHSTSDIYFAENKIFVHTNDAEFFVLSAQGEILDSFPSIDSIFVEMNGVLYMEDVYAIKAVDFSSRKELWRLELGTGYTYAPIFDNGTIFLRTWDTPATIYSIDQVTGDVNWKTSQAILSNLYVTEDKIYFLNPDSRLVVLVGCGLIFATN